MSRHRAMTVLAEKPFSCNAPQVGKHRATVSAAVNESQPTRIVALIPAHNEEELILESVQGLLGQSSRPTHIVVIADNCTDNTVTVVEEAGLEGVSVFQTTGNKDKKAGALNQYLSLVLPMLADDDVVLVQDADSILAREFVASAYRHVQNDRSLGAVGGTFRAVRPDPQASIGERFLVHLQDNEYARYARDVRRRRGKCLVVTGTASMFRVSTLRLIEQARKRGRLPPGDGAGGIYDTTVLTEDNELSFAILTVGMKILAPADCLLVTDAMTTWKDLWAQRLRWKRGAIENCFQYGLNRVTVGYWGRQLLSVVGISITILYIGSLAWSFIILGGVTIHVFWLALTGIFLLERFVTLKDKNLRQRFFAATMYELPYDFFLQIVQARAYIDVMCKTERKW